MTMANATPTAVTTRLAHRWVRVEATSSAPSTQTTEPLVVCPEGKDGSVAGGPTTKAIGGRARPTISFVRYTIELVSTMVITSVSGSRRFRVRHSRIPAMTTVTTATTRKEPRSVKAVAAASRTVVRTATMAAR